LHREANQFVVSVKNQYPEFFSGKKVLEVGSLDINGSVRQFFTDCDYLGIDLGEGPGVDRVKHVAGIPATERFDVVISTEALEHDERWNFSLGVMHDCLRPGGLLIVTCAGPSRWEHGTKDHDAYASPFTTDYYRNLSTEDFASVLSANLFSKSYLGYRGDKEDLYFAGIKRESMAQAILESLDRTNKSLDRIDRIIGRPQTITVEISTLNRYFTTLPMTIASIAMQTWKPDRLVIYDDGEQNELREIEPYTSLFRMLNDLEIPFETFKTPRLGLAANHQHALETCPHDFLLRVDDDHILEPNCIEVLLRIMEDETVGAVAPLVLHPGNVHPLPAGVEGKTEDIFNGVNMQWYDFNGYARETEHLYSCFLYRTQAGRVAGGYPNLSPVSFREDSWFSMKIRAAGFRLIVTPFARVHHLQQATGGIRAFSDGSLWDNDNKLFIEWLTATTGENFTQRKIAVLDNGIGDHHVFRGLLPRFIAKYGPPLLAVCYPEVFEGDDVEIISIADAKMRLGNIDQFNVYQFAGSRNWQRSLAEAFEALYDLS
jgi:SAM-dependent methyltransferase